MSEMQKEIYRDPKHQRARCREGEMPKVWREETGATHYCFSGKNLQKELMLWKSIPNVNVVCLFEYCHSELVSESQYERP
jgi:hypothetical protein